VLPLLQSSAGAAFAASFLARFPGSSSLTPAAASSGTLAEAVVPLAERYYPGSLANQGAASAPAYGKGESFIVSALRRLHEPCVLRTSGVRSRYIE
jgi:hypothetical protein